MSLPPDLKMEVVEQLERNAEKEIYEGARSRISGEKLAEFNKLLGVVDQSKLEVFLVEQVPQYFSLVTQTTKNVLERFKLSLKDATEINMQVSAQNRPQSGEVSGGEVVPS